MLWSRRRAVGPLTRSHSSRAPSRFLSARSSGRTVTERDLVGYCVRLFLLRVGGQILLANLRPVGRLDGSPEAAGECRCLARLNALQNDLVALHDAIESDVPDGGVPDQLSR